MCVDFCRADAGVAEHLLHGEQVGAAFEEVGGEAVAEGMRTDGFGDAVFLGQFLHDEEDHLSGETCTSAVEKHGVGEFGFRCDV